LRLFQFGKNICGDFLLYARLRTADKQPAGGALDKIKRIVKGLRER
jgi:hypothetical protein